MTTEKPSAKADSSSNSYGPYVNFFTIWKAIFSINGHQAYGLLHPGPFHLRVWNISFLYADGNHIIGSLKYHDKPVLCMEADDKFIITGSEDKTLCFYDRRAAKIYKSVRVCKISHQRSTE